MPDHTCQDCAYYNPSPVVTTAGYCHGQPPSVVLVSRSVEPTHTESVRPQVGADDLACSLLVLAPSPRQSMRFI